MGHRYDIYVPFTNCFTTQASKLPRHPRKGTIVIITNWSRHLLEWDGTEWASIDKLPNWIPFGR